MTGKIFLDGGAGYIGSVLIGYLLDEGYKVTCFDNLLYDKTSLLAYCSHKNFNFIKGDVRNFELLKKEISKHDIIIPFSALVGAPLCEKNPLDAKLVNFEHVKYLAKNKSKDQLLLYNNSNSGLGETDGKSLATEETEFNPISLYGKTKYFAELAVRESENHLVFRLATIFGKSFRPRNDLLVNNLVLRALKDRVLIVYEGHYIRNYLHIRDVCKAFVFALDNWDKCKNEVYNLGNDNLNMSKLDLCKKINEYIPVEIIEAQYTKDLDKRNYKISSQKFYNKGFQCEYSLDDGIKELMQVYKMIDVPQYANY